MRKISTDLGIYINGKKTQIMTVRKLEGHDDEEDGGSRDEAAGIAGRACGGTSGGNEARGVLIP